MSRPPPPAPPQNTRRHPRVDLFAQVQVSKDAEVYIMSTSNISRGGIFITGNPAEYPDLRRGITVDLTVFPGEDLGVPDARMQARIVRVVPSGRGAAAGFGLEFIIPLPPDQSQALDQLLLAVTSR